MLFVNGFASRYYIYYFEIPRKRPNELKVSAIGATYILAIFKYGGCDTQGIKK